MTISGPLAMSAYFLIFALVHSLLADPAFKRISKSLIGPSFDRWQRLAYSLLSMVMMLPFLFILVFLSDKTLYQIPTPWFILTSSCQILLAVALLLTLGQTGAFEFLGLAQIWDKSRTDNGSGLVATGFYSRTRNPLFLFAALIIWLSPIMTESLLAFNILATIYFYLGARHEERSLRAEFGREYEDYKARVPMFLPWP